MHEKTIAEISSGLENGEFTSVEITKHYLDRIKNLDGKMNAFVTVTEDIAIEQAQKADKIRKEGSATSLSGVPIAHKDIFCTTGVKSSCGSKMLDNFISPYESTVTQKLQDSGMVMLGKTNMDEFAMGSSNETSYYGPVKNPWDLERVPGGSSGGSAAAVAARVAPCSTGTDTGGSIRQPAALCGITGLKPTYGRVSRYGMIAFASSLDQAGVFAHTAEDCAMLLEHMAGVDEKDSTCINVPVPKYSNELADSIKGMNIGLPKEFFNDDLPAENAALIEENVKLLEDMGANVKTISLPNMYMAIPVYYIIAPAECSSNLARYDGVRFGYRTQEAKDLHELYIKTRTEGFGEEVKNRIMIGTYVLSAGYYDAYYLKAQKVRRVITEDFKKAFEEVDVIIGPTTPSPAFKIGAKTDDPVSMYLNDIYTSSVNLAGLPGISVPCGLVSDLPMGLHIIGKHFEESKILQMAHQYQLATSWHNQCPELA